MEIGEIRGLKMKQIIENNKLIGLESEETKVLAFVDNDKIKICKKIISLNFDFTRIQEFENEEQAISNMVI